MDQPARQLPLNLRMTSAGRAELRDAAAAENKSLPIHRWVPWIAGFSAQFVQDAISAYLPEPRRVGALVVDPFAGVGTTLVEALTAGCDTLGYDVNAFAVLAARVKLSAGGLDLATLDAETARFLAEVTAFEASVDEMWSELGALALVPILDNLRPVGAVGYRSRIPFFSLPVEAKFRFALAWLAERPEPIQSFGRLALGATMVSYSNYSYEPSLSSRPAVGKTIADNAPVGGPVSAKLKEMLADVAWAQETYGAAWTSHRRDVVLGSYFDAELAPDSISLIVTSPPYLNNYHYLRNTRPQLHWLGLVGEPGDLRIQEQASFGKNWQTVRQAKPIPLAVELPSLQVTLEAIREHNAERGAYGGPGWANYVATYFNDSGRFLDLVQTQLCPGGRAIVVVGNSIIQGFELRVDQLLGELAETRGFKVDEIRIVRRKRTGSSIIGSNVRSEAGAASATLLYDAAVVLQRLSP